jgi:dihydrofolate reductase
MKNISLIAAVSDNNVIGKDNRMPWHLPADMKWFKSLTTGGDVIMGKKTYYSLPVRPLPGRRNLIMSHDPAVIDGCVMASSVEDALSRMNPEKENFIIGGGSIYRQFMPLANRLYITRVFHSFDGDTFFPDINPEEWTLTFSEAHEKDEKHAFNFAFQIYERRNP